jgi:hypothetical protein
MEEKPGSCKTKLKEKPQEIYIYKTNKCLPTPDEQGT